MNNYTIEDKYKYYSTTITKGTQPKYYKDGYFYKLNSGGNEGLVEHLSTVLLKNPTLPRDYYVEYEFCKINNHLGCRSYNFCNSAEEFISMHTLYKKLTGYDNFADAIFSKATVEERLDFIMEIIDAFNIDTEMFREYLETIVQFDCLIRNIDRHAHNYGILYNNETDTYRRAPIFDNGRALGTILGHDDTACTISGSFDLQVSAFSYPPRKIFTIDYDKVSIALEALEESIGKHKEIDVLRDNIKNYGSMFNGDMNLF